MTMSPCLVYGYSRNNDNHTCILPDSVTIPTLLCGFISSLLPYTFSVNDKYFDVGEFY